MNKIEATDTKRRTFSFARLFVAIGLPGFAALAACAFGDPTSLPLPFDPPPLSVLHASPHKVFAHYFIPFPLSIDNQDAANDYYARDYLNPDGESGKHRDEGGYLRERPLPQSPRPEADWRLLNLEEEVRRADALGLDGFTCDLLSLTGNTWNQTLSLMEAAQAVDPDFKILLMPDMASLGAHTDGLADAITILAKSPAAYRLADGRLVIAPFLAEKQTPDWWRTWLQTMHDRGIDIAFVPCFLNEGKNKAAYASLCYGMSEWGDRTPLNNAGGLKTAADAHTYAKVWMQPVSPQDERPKDLIYQEAVNSENYRVMWMNAIDGGADWVQIVTWNDYSESTEIAPSTSIQWSFYDLTAYYVDWFKTGAAPKIRRDALYYFYRIHPTTMPAALPQARPFRQVDNGPPRNDIELLAFLTKPGKLSITIGGQTYDEDAPAGVTSFRAPIADGTPVFGLSRKNEPVITTTGAFAITDQPGIQDMQYHGGSSTRPAVGS